MIWPFKTRPRPPQIEAPVAWEGSLAQQAASKLTEEEIRALRPWLVFPALWPGVVAWVAMRDGENRDGSA